MEQAKVMNGEVSVLIMRDLAMLEASENFRQYCEMGAGATISLSSCPCVIMGGGRSRREILSFTAVYRKGNIVRYSAFEGRRHISSSTSNWEILLVKECTKAKLYLMQGDSPVFFPEECRALNNTDFLDVHYRTSDYDGIIRFAYINGIPCVFSDVVVNSFGKLYGQVVSDMASLVVDLCAFEQRKIPAIGVTK